MTSGVESGPRLSAAGGPLLSVVIPLYNEAENALPLAEALRAALDGLDYEIIYVDDGSSDGGASALARVSDERSKVIRFSRNFGQTAAMAAGIEAARGEFIATMDGDLQNDPADIPRMLRLLQERGADVVAGRRERRQDAAVTRKLPSKIANCIIRFATGAEVSDNGCSLRLYRSAAAKRLELYGELHRFISVLAELDGCRVEETPVRHHARKYGVSKYGLGRVFRVASDILLIVFLMRFLRRPMHLFGGLGVALLFLGGLTESYLLILKILGQDIGGRPLFFAGILCLLTGVQLITTGFLAEIMMRFYYGAGKARTPYRIRDILTGERRRETGQ